MGIGNWFKRLRARENAAAVERYEERRAQEGDLPAGERFLAGENRVERGVDEEITEGGVRGTLPVDSDEY
jgi:hypothetical protein